MDVKFPTLSGYTSLWETDALGTSDGDFFIRDDSSAGTYGSIGISGQYAGLLEADKWTRVAVTVDGSVNGGAYTVNGYIDGVLAGTATTSTAPNGKEAVKAILHLFADEGGETSAGLINSLAFYDEVLTPAAISALGAATASGIPVVAPPGVPGDYNQNNIVDAADYVVWRNNLGSAIPLPNEGSGITPGLVTTEDYSFWRSRFGATSGAGSVLASAVPEPGAAALLGLLALTGPALARRKR